MCVDRGLETLLDAMKFENDALEMNLEEYDMPTTRCERQRGNIEALRAALQAVKVEASMVDIEPMDRQAMIDGYEVIVSYRTKDEAEAIRNLLTGGGE